MKCYLLLLRLMLLLSLLLGWSWCGCGWVTGGGEEEEGEAAAAAALLWERRVLLEFKASLEDPDGILSGWDILRNTNHCSWKGIRCNPNSRVVSIHIPGGGGGAGGAPPPGNSPLPLLCSKPSLRFPSVEFGGGAMRRGCGIPASPKLSGELSPLVAKLAKLRVLSLPFHRLAGQVPPQIWDMDSLTVLNLQGNNFTGRLPVTFVGLERLRVLNLGFNALDGQIPGSFLSRCRSLEILNLSGNNLRGLIPDFFPAPKLRGVYLANNHLHGTVPAALGWDCRYLEHLDLSGNSLVGEIPPALGNCNNLRTLLLFSNRLKGSIPHQLGQLRRLQVLDVSTNFITGLIPPHLGNCSQLSVLVLSTLQEEERNSYQGSIPAEITALPNLSVLWAPGASLQGNLPANWGDCQRLEMLNLAHNGFSGSVEGVFDKCNKLYYLDLSSNRLSGDVDVLHNNLTSGQIATFSFSFCPIAPSLNSESFAGLLLHIYSRSGKIPCGWSHTVGASLDNLSGTFLLSRKMMNFSSSFGSPYLDTFRRVLLPASPSDPADGNGSMDVQPRGGNYSSETKTGNHGFNSIEIASIASASAIVSVLLALVVLFFYTRTWTPDARVQVIEPKDITTFIDIGVPLLYENIVQATGNFNASNCIGSGGFGATYKAEISPGSLLAIKRLAVGRFQGAQQFHAEIKALGRPSNILLDNEYNAYLSDFGLSRLLGTSETHATTGVAGTFGYVAPEYAMTCRVSEKADVYSYGVVLLELISDKKALDPSFCAHENGFNIVSWACMLLRRGRAKEVFTEGLWDSGPHDDLVEVLHLAVTCTVETLSTRPTMKQVVQRLKRIQPS
ncbi:hypothetical protein Tsubulata_023213 [Turnera subulata]|uniref:Protein kinase domain-containing protein n=1 Tax=Turnera subulata TaxID=218843 RepID=A0A9Q0J7N8_9ROSI|nr:hypothetical protein Tsubulata_023213 [Turnera subulata]